MKLAKFALTPPIMAISLALFAANRTEPVNLYVSEKGDWDPSGSGYTYTTIQDAVTDAIVAGDVIWVKDGFVCEEGIADATSKGCQNRIAITRKITLRSESGYVDEANKKGATIKGAWHDGTTPNGTSAVRCVYMNNTTGSLIQGFILEGGASGTAAGNGGGGLWGGWAKNCVIRGCYGSRGGGCASVKKLTGCVVSNCVATTDGHGLYACSANDSRILFNGVQGTAVDGGGTSLASNSNGGVFSNCVFACNRARNGGAVYTAISNYTGGYDFIDCVFSNNVATGNGIAHGHNTFLRCLVSGNRTDATSTSGRYSGLSGSSMTYAARVTDCTIIGNRAWASGTQCLGSGLYCAIAVNTVISNNFSCGGAAVCDSVLSGCLVSDNINTNYPGFTSSSGGYGGGMSGGSATNCIIRNNQVWHNHAYNAVGGGAFGTTLVNCVVTNNYADYWGGGYSGSGSCYNTLFVGNRAANESGGVDARSGNKTYYDVRLYNCTVTGNGAKSGFGGVRSVHAVNTISCGNKYNADSFLSATNCCSSVLTSKETYPGSVSSDPKFVGKGEFPYALRMHSPCKDTALELPWMSDAADPRSTALDGHARILGKGPDMGCYEYLPLGLLFMVR